MVPNTLGKDVLPPGDVIGMQFTDTFSIELETQIVDSINTYLASEQLFGNYIDPHFGRITATTFLEVLPRSGLNFGDAEDLIFDSLVLRMEINGAYGRSEKPQTLSIFELNEQIPTVDPIKRQLYSTTQLGYDPGPRPGKWVQTDSQSRVEALLYISFDWMTSWAKRFYLLLQIRWKKKISSASFSKALLLPLFLLPIFPENQELYFPFPPVM